MTLFMDIYVHAHLYTVRNEGARGRNLPGSPVKKGQKYEIDGESPRKKGLQTVAMLRSDALGRVPGGRSGRDSAARNSRRLPHYMYFRI